MLLSIAVWNAYGVCVDKRSLVVLDPLLIQEVFEGVEVMQSRVVLEICSPNLGIVDKYFSSIFLKPYQIVHGLAGRAFH